VSYLQFVVPVAVLIGLWLWRTSVNNRRTFEKVADGVESMRRAGLEQPRFVPVDGRDARDARARQRFADASRELETNGFVPLGELMEEKANRSAMGVLAWFRDASGTICGWFGVLRGDKPVMLFFSETTSGEFFITTRGGADLHVTQPPTVHHAHGPWAEGFINQLRQHRDQLAQRPGANLTRIQSPAEGTELLRRLRASVATWRAAQPHAVLLEGDLRRILRDKYENLGPGVLKVFAARGTTR